MAPASPPCCHAETIPARVSGTAPARGSDAARLQGRRFAADFAGDDGAAVLRTSPPSFNYVQVLVRPEARRRGIGTALLAEVVASARRQGISSFFAHQVLLH